MRKFVAGLIVGFLSSLYVFFSFLIRKQSFKTWLADQIEAQIRKAVYVDGRRPSSARYVYQRQGYPTRNVMREQVKDRVNLSKDYKNFGYNTWADAKRVLDAMRGLVTANQFATVSDLKELSGARPMLIDRSFGWTSVGDAIIRFPSTDNFFRLEFPEPEML